MNFRFMSRKLKYRITLISILFKFVYFFHHTIQPIATTITTATTTITTREAHKYIIILFQLLVWSKCWKTFKWNATRALISYVSIYVFIGKLVPLSLPSLWALPLLKSRVNHFFVFFWNVPLFVFHPKLVWCKSK